MLRLFILLALVFSVTAQAQAPAQTRLQAADAEWTQLGLLGNREVAQRFASFEKSNRGCVAVNGGRRVILTGFGLFSGVQFNVSGAVVDNLGHEEFWPRETSLNSVPLPNAGYAVRSGSLREADGGAKIVNREFIVDGQLISACLIQVDVLWDFAGAVIAREIERFQPLSVVMTGLGEREPVIESGALNRAIPATGFYPGGESDERNRPRGDVILTGEQRNSSLPMSWDNAVLAARVRTDIERLGYTLQVPTSARNSNDYICNNVSYIAVAAAAGRPLSLAGGLVTINPSNAPVTRPRMGFFHLPLGVPLEAKQLQAWAKVLLTISL